MNHATFFAELRKRGSGIFGTSLSQRQVDGIEALLAASGGMPIHHVANILGQVYRETGGGMYPVKETVMPWHKNKNPSDAEVIRRLDRAFAAGQLPWVRTPYWRGGAFGRGQIQLTTADNYAKFGISNYADALKLDVSAWIAVSGMSKGRFTGRKLSDYNFPEALYASPSRNPRRIVNGNDGSDAEVAKFHMAFYKALSAAGYGDAGHHAAPPAPQVILAAPTSPKPAQSPWAALFAAFLAMFRSK